MTLRSLSRCFKSIFYSSLRAITCSLYSSFCLSFFLYFFIVFSSWEVSNSFWFLIFRCLMRCFVLVSCFYSMSERFVCIFFSARSSQIFCKRAMRTRLYRLGRLSLFQTLCWAPLELVPAWSLMDFYAVCCKLTAPSWVCLSLTKIYLTIKIIIIY